jgi:hypothetical protein
MSAAALRMSSFLVARCCMSEGKRRAFADFFPWNRSAVASSPKLTITQPIYRYHGIRARVKLKSPVSRRRCRCESRRPRGRSLGEGGTTRGIADGTDLAIRPHGRRRVRVPVRRLGARTDGGARRPRGTPRCRPCWEARPRCGHGEEVNRCKSAKMVVEKGAPGLRRRLALPLGHETGDATLADLDAELEQLTMDSGPKIQGPDSGTSFHHSENPLRSPALVLGGGTCATARSEVAGGHQVPSR